MSTPIVDLFVMTYGADAEWFRYCIRSAKKNLRGVRDIVAGCPNNIISVERTCQEYGVRLFQFEHRDPGHMQHQVYKMRADEFVRPGAEWICMVDSDCVFHKPVNVHDQFIAGKPIYCFDTWEADHTYQWRTGTEKFIGREIRLNFMRRLGMFFKPGHLQYVRYAVETAHNGYKFEDLVMACWDSSQEWFPARGPDKRLWQPFGKPTISEYCMIGQLMWERFPDHFCWWDVNCLGWPGGDRESFFKQYWSHFDVTQEIRAELDKICEGV